MRIAYRDAPLTDASRSAHISFAISYATNPFRHDKVRRIIFRSAGSEDVDGLWRTSQDLEISMAVLCAFTIVAAAVRAYRYSSLKGV